MRRDDGRLTIRLTRDQARRARLTCRAALAKRDQLDDQVDDQVIQILSLFVHEPERHEWRPHHDAKQ